MAAAVGKRSERDPDTRRSTVFLAALEGAYNEVEQCIVGLESVMARPEGAGTAEFSVTRPRQRAAPARRSGAPGTHWAIGES